MFKGLKFKSLEILNLQYLSNYSITMIGYFMSSHIQNRVLGENLVELGTPLRSKPSGRIPVKADEKYYSMCKV